MIKQETKEAVLNLPVGGMIDVKPRMITYTIYRASETEFALDRACDGWQSCIINPAKMEEVLNDEEKFYELDWE